MMFKSSVTRYKIRNELNSYNGINNNNLYNTSTIKLSNNDNNSFDFGNSQQSHNWDNVVNVWKWNEKYHNIPLTLYSARSGQINVSLKLVLDIAVLVSSWRVIAALIKHGILVGFTKEDYNFYVRNLKDLRLPQCDAVENYQMYLDDRNEIREKLLNAMKSKIMYSGDY